MTLMKPGMTVRIILEDDGNEVAFRILKRGVKVDVTEGEDAPADTGESDSPGGDAPLAP